MRRRNFIAGLVSTAAAWPIAASAQQPSMPVIGFLNGQSPRTWAPMVATFRRGLNEAGTMRKQLASDNAFSTIVQDRIAPNPDRASTSPRPSSAAQRGFLTVD